MENWDDIRVFLAVARGESLTAGGKRLRLDPGTVGRRIARLEETMGASLFVKSPQGYGLTDMGQRFLTHAESAEAALAAAREEPDDSLTGQIRIGAPDGCANYLLPHVAADLTASHPGLEIQILALPRIVNLSQREADMAITVSPPSTGRLTVQKIADYHLHLAAHEDWIAAHGPFERPSDLKGHPVIGYIPDMIFDKELDYLGELAKDGVALASNSVAVQVQLLQTGQGVGIAHDFALPAAPGLRRLMTEEVSLTRSFYLVRHASDRRSARLTQVADAVVAGLRARIAAAQQEVSLTEGRHH